jgi:hypothetical protein
MCKYIVETKEDEIELGTVAQVVEFATNNLSGEYDSHMNFVQVKRELERNGYHLDVEN